MIAKHVFFYFVWILIRKDLNCPKILNTLLEKMLILLETNIVAINGNFHLVLSPLNHSVKLMADDICRWHRLAYWHRGTAFVGQYLHSQI